MTSETNRRIDCVFVALNILQQRGIIPVSGRISTRGLAHLSEVIDEPVSEKTFRRLESQALAKAQSRARVILQAAASRQTQS